MRDPAEIVPFDGDHCADFGSVVHDLPNAAQIAQPLFANIAGQKHVNGGRHAEFIKQALPAPARWRCPELLSPIPGPATRSPASRSAAAYPWGTRCRCARPAAAAGPGLAPGMRATVLPISSVTTVDQSRGRGTSCATRAELGAFLAGRRREPRRSRSRRRLLRRHAVCASADARATARGSKGRVRVAWLGGRRGSPMKTP